MTIEAINDIISNIRVKIASLSQIAFAIFLFYVHFQYVRKNKRNGKTKEQKEKTEEPRRVTDKI